MASYITALVIQKVNSVFLSEDGPSAEKISGSPQEFATGIGVTMEIPCPDSSSGGVIDGDYWAEPVNNGVVSGFTYKPYNPSETVSTKPSPESFAVVRISSRFSNDDWYILGSSDDYIASCAACCDDTPTPMPGVNLIPLQPACQTMCNFNNGTLQQYFAVLGLPALTGNRRYFPYGYFNDIALPTGAATGYATTGTLLTFLNTATTTSVVNGVTTYTGGWAIVGTWTVTSDSLTLLATQTAGPGTDVLCAAVAAINPSL